MSGAATNNPCVEYFFHTLLRSTSGTSASLAGVAAFCCVQWCHGSPTAVVVV